MAATRKKTTISKFNIEHGASKINLVLLKINIEDISNDIDLMGRSSDKKSKYILNELLRFARARKRTS